MMDGHPWLAVTQGHALRFFFEHLRDVTDVHPVPEPELLYNASMLAHFATTSAASTEFPGTPVTLDNVFSLFVMDRSQHDDPEIMEAAAAQCLLLTGFFGAQLCDRHNVNWFASLGAGFFGQAARRQADPTRARMMRSMAAHFSFWRRKQAKLARELHDRPLLVNTLGASPPDPLLAHSRTRLH
jgi:hypothetical protein